ncbi:MAG: MFS transporter [Actinobacteria bacterium]|nr:MFS transporter [Actinomycetota bacterium]
MKGTLSRAREALRSRDFRFLLSARLVNTAGDGFFNAAIVGAAAFGDNQDTVSGLARALVITILPYSILGPFIGVFIDRWSRRKILVRGPLIRAVCIVPLVLLADSPNSWGFLLAALAAAGVNRFTSSTSSAVIPRVVPHEDLLMANSMATVGATFTMALFAFAGGLLADSVGEQPLFVSLIAIWALAALIARGIASDLQAPHAPAMRLHRDLGRVAAEMIDGVKRLSRAPQALAPIATIAWDQLIQAVAFVLSIVVFRDEFGQGVGAYSWVLAAGAVGLLLGIATVGVLENSMSRARMIVLALAVSGVAPLAAIFFITRPTVLAMGFLVGLSYAWKKVSVDTMVQEAVPDDFRGRAFAIYDVAFNVGRVIGTVLAVWLIPAAGTRGTLLAVGAGMLLWIPLLLAWLKRPTPRGVWDAPVV